MIDPSLSSNPNRFLGQGTRRPGPGRPRQTYSTAKVDLFRKELQALLILLEGPKSGDRKTGARRNSLGTLAKLLDLSSRTIQKWTENNKTADGQDTGKPALLPSWKQLADLGYTAHHLYHRCPTVEEEALIWINYLGVRRLEEKKWIEIDAFYLKEYFGKRPSFIPEAKSAFDSLVKRLRPALDKHEALISASAYFTQISFQAAFEQFLSGEVQSVRQSKAPKRMAVFWSKESFALPPFAPPGGQRATIDLFSMFLRRCGEKEVGMLTCAIHVFIVDADANDKDRLRAYLKKQFRPAVQGPAIRFHIFKGTTEFEHIADTFLLFKESTDQKDSFMALVTEQEAGILKKIEAALTNKSIPALGTTYNPYPFVSQVSRTNWNVAKKYLVKRQAFLIDGSLKPSDEHWEDAIAEDSWMLLQPLPPSPSTI